MASAAQQFMETPAVAIAVASAADGDAPSARHARHRVKQSALPSVRAAHIPLACLASAVKAQRVDCSMTFCDLGADRGRNLYRDGAGGDAAKASAFSTSMLYLLAGFALGPSGLALTEPVTGSRPYDS